MRLSAEKRLTVVLSDEHEKRIIFHVNMDAFYASVEESLNPDYRGKPLIVRADPKGGKGREVVLTANYEARKFGIHSQLVLGQINWLLRWLLA